MNAIIKTDSFQDDLALPAAKRLTGYKDPFRFDNPNTFKGVMYESLKQGASDIYIQPGYPICARINDAVLRLTDRTLDESEVNNILKWVGGRDTTEVDILSGKPVECRYELFDQERRDERGAKVRYGYRVNGSPIQYAGRTSIQIVMRAIPNEPPKYHEVGLSEEIVNAATPRDGIVYVAGATGSGKTTTFASIIRYILENDTPIKGNLITHEEPIEFLYHKIKSKHSIIVQSDIPSQFKSFSDANTQAMRRRPGLILIGELRDAPTIMSAVEAALTGHPVFGTVHAINVAAVIRRLISRFPETERATAIFDIIDTARLIIAQRLVMGINGKLLAAREYLVFDEEVREELLNLTQMGKVTSKVRSLVEEKGHSFTAEGKRLRELGLINESTERELSRM